MNPFFRIDNRLVHGQIIATWVPKLRLKRVVILSDTVPQNPLQMSMFQMAMPSGVRFAALSISEGATWLKNKTYGRDNTLVLFENVEDAALLFTHFQFSQLNVGNVHHAAGARRFTNAVYLTAEQLGTLKTLSQRGVQVEIRSLPDELPQPVGH